MEIDWEQARLNGFSYCFSIQNDGSFCGRAESWAGHSVGDVQHDFETLADFLDNKREDCRWIDSKLAQKCKRLEEDLKATSDSLKIEREHYKRKIESNERYVDALEKVCFHSRDVDAFCDDIDGAHSRVVVKSKYIKRLRDALADFDAVHTERAKGG